MTKRAQVYFVDGPQAVGKDYTVDQMFEEGQKLLGDKCVKLRATDFFPERLNSELRKYVEYNTEERKTATIAAAHVRIFDAIDELVLSGAKLIIVNRGVLTSLAYNLWKQEQFVDRQIYLRWYATLIHRYMRFFDIRFYTLHEKLEVVAERIKARDENKPIDLEWTKQLSENYMKAVSDFSPHVLFHRHMTWNDYHLNLYKEEIRKIEP